MENNKEKQERLRQALSQKADESKQKPDVATSQKAEEQQKPNDVQNNVASNENNSYIPPKSEESGVDAEDLAVEKLLNETFEGDPKKAAKSYLHSQRAIQKALNEKKELEAKAKELEEKAKVLEQFDSVVKGNPLLAEMLSKAVRGESIENHINAEKEPSGKPVSRSESGKLDSTLTAVDDNELAKAGYLDLADKDQYSAIEWHEKRLEAKAKYFEEVLPKKAVEKQLSLWEAKQRELEEAESRKRQAETSQKRYETSFNRVVASGWDFAGEHNKYLDEINELAKGIRDPKNPALLNEEAFEMAAERIARKHNLVIGKKQLPNPQGKLPTGNNLRGAVPPVNQPMSPLDKLYQQKLKQNKERNDRRGQLLSVKS